jgi:integrase
VFGPRRAANVTGAEITAYVVQRQQAGAANGTINRELGTLNRMYTLERKAELLHRVPYIQKLEERNARQGFFEREQYELLPPDLQAVVTIAYTFGWRIQIEVLTLERRQLDLDAGESGILRLDPNTTKNGEGRFVHLTPELRALLTAQVERVRALEKKTGRVVPYLFPYLGRYRDSRYGMKGQHVGTRRQDFRKVWRSACVAAGVPGALRHDFRRTAVRNLDRTSVPRSVAMAATGHKAEAVYRRYAIVRDSDMQGVARQLAAAWQQGKVLGKVAEIVPLRVSQVSEIMVGGAGLEPATSAL